MDATHSDRLLVLDSLRGLAALSVVFHHHLLAFPALWTSRHIGWRLIRTPPFMLLWAGHPAVIFFFVLSGLVLVVPYLRTDQPYRAWITKRILRLYPTYIISTLIYVLTVLLIKPHPISGLDPWFNAQWTRLPSAKELLTALSLAVPFNYLLLNSVIWSLVLEMQVCFIFPLIVWLVKNWSWPWVVVFGLASGITGTHLIESRYASVLGIGNLLSSLMPFLCGALIAKHKDAIVRYVSHLKSYVSLMLLILGMALYLCRFHISIDDHNVLARYSSIIVDYITVIGVVVIITLSLSKYRLQKWLHNPVTLWLGKVSYSLYLLHSLFLLGMLHLLWGRWPVWAIMCLSIASSMLVSHLSYRYLERPSINLGRDIYKKLAHKQH